MKNNEFKPCPFCGSEDINGVISKARKAFIIYCEDCCVCLDLPFADLDLGDGSFMTFNEAQKGMDTLKGCWNRRVSYERAIKEICKRA